MSELEILKIQFEPVGAMNDVTGDYNCTELSFGGLTPNNITKISLTIEAGEPVILHVEELGKDICPNGISVRDVQVSGPVNLVITTKKTERLGGKA